MREENAMRLESDPTENDERGYLEKVLAEVRHWLPEQGPIQVFIHHNTLHALEEHRFETAVEHAAQVRGTEPYLSHQHFLAEVANGRIPTEAVDRALRKALDVDGGERLIAGFGRLDIRRALLAISDEFVPHETLLWLRAERSDFRTPSALNLWEAIDRRMDLKATPAPVHRTSRPTVNEQLSTLCAAYLDQGMSYWPMPHRHRGFLDCYRTLAPQKVPEGDAQQIILRYLKAQDPNGKRWKEILLEEALSLPGWSGTFSLLETRPALLPEGGPPASFAEFMAVRLSLVEAEDVVQIEAKRPAPARELTLFKLLEALGGDGQRVDGWSENEWRDLLAEVNLFDDVSRRRTLQLAYEDYLYRRFLGALVDNGGRNASDPAPSPKYQAIFCIDDREESIRRHIEETSPLVETFAVAGFFGIDMWYQGLGAHRPVALCPVVIIPKHIVRESAVESAQLRGRSKLRRQKTFELFATNIYDHSRNLLLGWWLAAVAGIAAVYPLFTRILFPRWAARFNRYLASLWFPTVETDLLLMRDENCGPDGSGLIAGYNLDEMTARVEGILRAIGLTQNFASLVFVFGHGSNSLNNPHESAYDCGACGGGRGGPNARAFARMANLDSVRAGLASRGIHIPVSTHFVGSFHDTCSDGIDFFDVSKIPLSHRAGFDEAKAIFDQGRERDAHERCRRFENAGALSPKKALLHVEGRCQDLREPRPECGHATNAVCVVGRRELTRHLYMDRRSFLASYDCSSDPEGKILSGILGAVIPVCAGISLEYYFSYVDSEGYGAGTKLPHNITALMGVMNGRVSDLRTGLPWQMVEIHEPVRCLFVIEAKRWKLEALMEANEGVRKLVKNGWVRLAVIDPTTRDIEMYEDGAFRKLAPGTAPLASYPTSRSYYDKHAGHLWPVRIEEKGVRS